MAGKVQIEKKDGYILVNLSDVIITKARAEEILSEIAEQSIKLKCNKVLLNEKSVVGREVSLLDIKQLSEVLCERVVDKIFIAFLCQSKMIDEDSELLRAFTFEDECLLQYFTESDDAVAWLESKTANAVMPG